MAWTSDQKAFMIWLATPKAERVPKRQGGWAKKHGYAAETLSRWKNQEGFMKEVETYRVKYLESHLSDLYGAMVKHAVAGNHNYAKMILEIYNDRFNTMLVKHGDIEAQVQDMTEDQIVERMFDILKNGDPDGSLDKNAFFQAFANHTVQQRTQGEA